MAGTSPLSLFDPLFSSDRVLAATSPGAWVAALLAFERELAAAEAELGILSANDAEAVADACSRFDLAPDDLGSRGRAAGNPVVPLVAALRSLAGDHASAVHHGATSQDAMDSAAMLVAKHACRIVVDDLDGAARACAGIVRRHRAAVMVGRTLLQPAVPVTFGFKAARWLAGLTDAAAALERAADARLAVELGGAAGTLAAWGDRGLELCALLARRLGLQEPVVPWHTDRSRLVELSGALVVASAAAAKVALDVALLSQAEVGEASEAGDAGHGGSSTMPHKSNPVSSVLVLAAWRRAQGAASTLSACAVQDHERGATGGWHAEWESLTDLLRAAGGCAFGIRKVLGSLRVDAARLARNLEATDGVVMAERVSFDLATDLGREAASDIVARAAASAAAEGRTLRDVLGSVPEVAARRSPAELDALFDPSGYLGATDALVERVLAAHDAREREALAES
jgi:3-carboxy-cis,cis-muconate cycloisomerase